MVLASRAPRLLVIPGLHDSGAAHWQTWLQSQYRDADRVVQRDWAEPDLERWAARIGTTLERAAERGNAGPCIAVAHSFGCLALARHLALRADSPVRAALFVAPADPDKFGVAGLLPQQRLALPSTVVASDTDPWMSAAASRRWAQRWGSAWLTLGDAGHINTEAGFGPLPLARRWVTAMAARLAREQRPERATLAEWSFAV
ncbi:RBBP9/YdeN family alpha/beta hydrolase [Methylibium sp.]|uniref:RBBP9/YdeN family alpha/beta hydrolase n=1 Tax=Methylibium sp. TaxID=2067992 RepID=UPI003D129F6B